MINILQEHKNKITPYYEARKRFNLKYNGTHVINLFENHETKRLNIILHDLINENSVKVEIPFAYINEVKERQVLEAYELLIEELPNDK